MYPKQEKLLTSTRWKPSEVGVNLKQGYNGDLTSKQAGYVGGQMVNTMIFGDRFDFIRKNRNAAGHQQTVTYNVTVGI